MGCFMYQYPKQILTIAQQVQSYICLLYTSLAAVLAMEPGYLVLDEPTTGLDRQRKEMLKGYLKKVCEEKHCGILIISHDWEFVESCAHEKLFLGGESDVFSG